MTCPMTLVCRETGPQLLGSPRSMESILFSHSRNEHILCSPLPAHCHPCPQLSLPALVRLYDPFNHRGRWGRGGLCLPNRPFPGEPAFVSALVLLLPRHNTYLQECTGQREPTYQLNIHDIKLLFLRFAMEQSFSADTGGGGRESNIHLIPYIIHTVLYVLNTSVSRGTRGHAGRPARQGFPLLHTCPSWFRSEGPMEGSLH